ncbi:hypothetical protein GWO43_01410 [candidate division KSB1 bacterium]|nr:hypothetical protein [candidate division KSB1 bacterium]NIR69329.1 hypothetical protein [candidate division KSB1 bacterium]NIS22730.1 hypothetical protein [candidate division KSB1 bacterium]NIT69577.1 hypothetical protein [candidate division KSB1 bacterium]NIU23232.1 hypothetical protein [candidate division KSB1 bacterium]
MLKRPTHIPIRTKLFDMILLAILCFQTFLLSNAQTRTVNDLDVIVVSRDELKAAMRLPSGYDPTATTNVGRFQADVILHLAREAHKQNPNGPPLLIRYNDWFWAFLQVNDIPLRDAPKFSLLAYEHQQNQLIDYRRDRVIQQVVEGPSPELAVNVKVWWPESADLPDKYSFEDKLSTPKLKVTNHRVITYRLLEFDNMVVYDDMHGITGRPTSGVLSFLFRLIGEGRVVYSRIAISEDGLQINRTKAKKGPFSVTETVMVQSNGHTEKGLPANRPDLEKLEEKLKQKIEIEYVPFEYGQIE